MSIAGPLALCLFLFSLNFCMSWLSMTLLPFVRSGVCCDVPPAAGNFSGSAACGDEQLVVAASQRLDGQLMGFTYLIGVVAAPCFGALADERGCLQAIALGVALFTLSMVLLVVAATGTPSFPCASADLHVALPTWSLFASYCLSGCVSLVGPTNAMAMQLVSEDYLTAMFSWTTLAQVMGGMLGSTFSVVLLKQDFVDYAPIWLVFTVAAGVCMGAPIAILARCAKRFETRKPKGMLKRMGATKELGLAIATSNVKSRSKAWIICNVVATIFADVKHVASESAFVRQFGGALSLTFAGGLSTMYILPSFSISTLGWEQVNLRQLSSSSPAHTVFPFFLGFPSLCGLGVGARFPSLASQGDFQVAIVLLLPGAVIGGVVYMLVVSPRYGDDGVWLC
eukprot:4650729-Prymnesium_polylepis.1